MAKLTLLLGEEFRRNRILQGIRRQEIGGSVSGKIAPDYSRAHQQDPCDNEKKDSKEGAKSKTLPLPGSMAKKSKAAKKHSAAIGRICSPVNSFGLTYFCIFD
jgi:hypothetical protein